MAAHTHTHTHTHAHTHTCTYSHSHTHTLTFVMQRFGADAERSGGQQVRKALHACVVPFGELRGSRDIDDVVRGFGAVGERTGTTLQRVQVVAERRSPVASAGLERTHLLMLRRRCLLLLLLLKMLTRLLMVRGVTGSVAGSGLGRVGVFVEGRVAGSVEGCAVAFVVGRALGPVMFSLLHTRVHTLVHSLIGSLVSRRMSSPRAIHAVHLGGGGV
jgi:hypothetical protein